MAKQCRVKVAGGGVGAVAGIAGVGGSAGSQRKLGSRTLVLLNAAISDSAETRDSVPGGFPGPRPKVVIAMR